MVLNSKWAQNPVSLTDPLSSPTWMDANVQHLPIAGKSINLHLLNDAHYMYLAIGMPDEQTNNTAGEYFWLSFDVNKNGSINPNQDVNYSIFAGNPGKVVKQYYLGPSTWTGIQGTAGDYVFAFEPSPAAPTPHKVWRLRIPLSDFGINLSAPNVMAWMGLRVHVSGHDYDFPANFSNSGFNTMSSAALVFARNAVIDPALMGPIMAAVGLIPTAVSVINPATGRATTAAGYYVWADKSAFGGMLNLIFNHNNINPLRAAGAVKYKVTHGLVGGPQTLLQSAWSNYRWVGNDVVLDAFGPDGGGFYNLPNPAAQYSIQDLLIQFNSGLLPNGKYQFTVQFFNAASVAMPAPAQTLVLFIDNTVPVVAINKISRATAPGVDVLLHVCDPLTLGHSEGLVFDITANDPEGDIASFGINWAQGDGGGDSLFSDNYVGKPAGWTGVTNMIVPAGTPWAPAKTCVYSFSLGASSRTTNGYGSIGSNSVSKSLYIVKS